jgi:hypothetical protein
VTRNKVEGALDGLASQRRGGLPRSWRALSSDNPAPHPVRVSSTPLLLKGGKEKPGKGYILKTDSSCQALGRSLQILTACVAQRGAKCTKSSQRRSLQRRTDSLGLSKDMGRKSRASTPISVVSSPHDKDWQGESYTHPSSECPPPPSKIMYWIAESELVLGSTGWVLAPSCWRRRRCHTILGQDERRGVTGEHDRPPSAPPSEPNLCPRMCAPELCHQSSIQEHRPRLSHIKEYTYSCSVGRAFMPSLHVVTTQRYNNTGQPCWNAGDVRRRVRAARHVATGCI